MKIFPTAQIASIDQATILNEPIDNIDLMERAAKTVADYVIDKSKLEGEVIVFCGPGNNGGDGLAVARILAEVESRFSVTIIIIDFGKGLKGSPEINRNRLQKQQKAKICFVNSISDLPHLTNNCLIIDALFGSGLNRPLEGLPAEIVKAINQTQAIVLSIDIPSGLMGEDNVDNLPECIVKADRTITFQFPKLSFMFAENEAYIGDLRIHNIGLSPQAISQSHTPYYLLEDVEVVKLIKTRTKFSHKGNFGHALFVSGSYGKIGAAVLGSKACLRSGVGLLTTHVPCLGYEILQTTIPEAMTSIDESDLMFTGVHKLEDYSAIGVGPGIGQKVNTCRGLKKLIEEAKQPIVFDADALNILGQNREWLSQLPKESILTPHPKEFERLAGKAQNSYLRMKLAIEFAKNYNVILVVKGAHTMVINTKGDVWFNSTGNPGMATAGSGDVLTGIILALLAQRYTSFDAARIGVYVHGLAGDIAAARRGYESLIASDIVENLGEAFKLLHK